MTTEFHLGFPQLLQANAKVVPQLGHNRSFYILFYSLFANYPTIRLYIVGTIDGDVT
jgi:hypothetical protein